MRKIIFKIFYFIFLVPRIKHGQRVPKGYYEILRQSIIHIYNKTNIHQ